MASKPLGRKARELLECLNTTNECGRPTNYAHAVNTMPELFVSKDQWVILGKETDQPRYYPVFNHMGQQAINELYNNGKVHMQLGLGPNCLQTFSLPDDFNDCISEGLLLEKRT